MQDTLIQLSWEDLKSDIPVYTIGYGGRSLTSFLELLRTYEIQFLIDIRSKPYSRANQQYSRENLEQSLKKHDIRYVFMGDTLGGRPGDPSCYLDGKVDYSKVRDKDFFKRGIERVYTAWSKQIPVALMCAELKPEDCHRSKLIGNTLTSQNITIAHIDELGKLKTQPEINQLLIGDQQLSLFEVGQSSILDNEKINFSRKKYQA